MKDKKEYSLVMLPTEKASRIFISNNELFITQSNNSSNNVIDNNYTNQHLSIISDDEIKEGDWLLDTKDNRIHKALQINKGGYIVINLEKRIVVNQSYCKKIVATTDKSLRYKSDANENTILPLDFNIPQIPESFKPPYIKAYNEGKPITEIQLEMEIHTVMGGGLLPMGEIGGKGNQAYNTKHIKTRPDNTVIIIGY